ncbi:MAG: DUF3298 domain-containing protein [Alcanivorax sp.]|nr:DUF3298 domain-containing protein [Alcanivorax sp.]
MRMTLVVLLGLLALGGCDNSQDHPKKDTAAPLALAQHGLEKSLPGCAGDHCPRVTLRWVSIDQQPALNQALLAALAGMLESDEQAPAKPPSPQQLADSFLADAEDVPMADQQNWQLSGSASLMGRQGTLLTFELQSYEFTGGAHGMPGLAYLHWDLADKHAIALADLLQPGQSQAFWTQAKQRHQQWLKQHKLGASFQQSWPFEKTDNFYLGDDGLTLQYNVYQLAPYAMGQPQLVIPYAQLDGILKPAYMK